MGQRRRFGCVLALLPVIAGCTGGPPEPLPAPVTPIEPAASGWWREAVFYEVFVRSFADASAGPLADDGIGDLAGLLERLDHVNDGDPATDTDLGATALWLMPVMPSPSYHGYDVTDYRGVEPDYGTLADLHRLVAECHRRGVRVVLDLVLNHTSDRHPWFVDAVRERSPYHRWYRWDTGSHRHLGPWGQEVWHQLPWWQRGWRHFDYLAYYGLFSRRMPDLDHTEPAVWHAVQEIARFWLVEVGVDGFRLDAVRHLIEDGAIQQDTPATHAWLRRFHAYCRDLRPDALLVGEVWDRPEIVDSYGLDELDLAFLFGLAEALLRAVRIGERGPLGEALPALLAGRGAAGSATFLANHDQNRVMWHVDGRPQRAALAAGLLLTLPGTPFLYYGEEIGMTGRKPDPDIRSPMQWRDGRHGGFSSHRPWRRVHSDLATANVASQSADPASLLTTYRRLVRLRLAHPALAVGSLEVLETSSPTVLATLRRTEDEALLVLANLGETPTAKYRLDLPPELSVTGPDLLGGGALVNPADPGRPVPELAPGSIVVLALEVSR